MPRGKSRCRDRTESLFRGGGQRKKIYRHWSIVSQRSSAESFHVHPAQRIRRLSLDSGLSNINMCPNFNSKSCGSHGEWRNEGILGLNAKETMKVLNDRLTTYLNKVASLREENQHLERKIKKWYEENKPQQLNNCTKYLKTIEELQTEIFNATMENKQVLLHIGNLHLAGDDLQNKYNMEFGLYETIEADVDGLRVDLDRLTLQKCDLEYQIERLIEDLLHLKKKHSEEVENLKAQKGTRVNVDVEAAPTVDLINALSDIRNKYETLVDRNVEDVEKWFVTQSKELNFQPVSGGEQLFSGKSEVTKLRRVIQNLETDLQTQLQKKSALEVTLAEREDSYSFQLAQIQKLVNNEESDLSKLRYDLEHQNHEHKILMDMKTRLEMEISTYRRLLEEEDIHTLESDLKQNKGLKIVSITEELQDGKIVSKQENVHYLPC